MKVAITGATGFVGRPLCERLLADGYEVLVLTRDRERAARVLPARCRLATWDPERHTIDANVLTGVDAVVSLAGTSVAEGRWTARRKESIRRSRIDGTRMLVDAIAALPAEQRPRIFLSASAIGYYGDRDDEVLTEQSPPGSGFLADVCREWEAEALVAERHGLRTVLVRTGIVLGRGGGALASLLPIFRLGLGGRVGSGRQWMSWIHLDDLIGLWMFALGRAEVRGPVNGVAPNPVTNADFTATLARVLARPAVIPVPALALRVGLGEMANVLLEGQRVRPEVAATRGFVFRHPELGEALVDVTRDPATTLVMEQWVPRPPEEVFPFFSDAHNLERLTPPFLKFRILDVSTPAMQTGTRIDYQLSLHGVPVRWQSLIQEWNPIHSFVDTQTKGPYQRWDHTHEFEAYDGGTVIRDRVHYELPIGALGAMVAGRFVAKDVQTIFTYRREKIREIFG
ncbi:MAG: TIGR01777 family oxidoreductase [Candidatus Binatia bacterium]